MSNWMPKTSNMIISERIHKLREIFREIKVEKDVIYCGTIENDSEKVENIRNLFKTKKKEARTEKSGKQQNGEKISKTDPESHLEPKHGTIPKNDVKNSSKSTKNDSKPKQNKYCDREMQNNHILELNSRTERNKDFLLNRNLKNHLDFKTKHPDGQAYQFECDFDGKIFKRRGELYSHMKLHLPLVECQICHKMLKILCIKSHLRNFHATGPKLQCKICSKNFKSPRSLHNHEKTHNKTHKCDICKRMFPFKSCLNRHKKEYHENAKSIECEICGKKFNQKMELKSHQKTHDKNRPKPLKCQRCDYATDTKHCFKRHQESHERQDKKIAAMKNPIKYDKCSTFCKDSAAFYNHMKYVHPKNLYQCDLCALFIKCKHSLVKHANIHIKKLQTINFDC